jgi:hypothetical protein
MEHCDQPIRLRFARPCNLRNSNVQESLVFDRKQG